MPFTDRQRGTLLGIARRSIESGLRTGGPWIPDPAEFDPALSEPGACFVTLEVANALRGCIGHLDASRPLARDVAGNAFAAAFEDPRFPPLPAEEWPGVHVELSVLSRPEPLRFDSEADLLRQLRPGVDGLILRDGPYRGTFLPSVWAQLPDPREFLCQLKRKAGLSPGHWSARIEVARYTTEHFGADVAAIEAGNVRQLGI
jgi:AmmeMemoRadiSam system protein A